MKGRGRGAGIDSCLRTGPCGPLSLCACPPVPHRARWPSVGGLRTALSTAALSPLLGVGPAMTRAQQCQVLPQAVPAPCTMRMVARNPPFPSPTHRGPLLPVASSLSRGGTGAVQDRTDAGVYLGPAADASSSSDTDPGPGTMRSPRRADADGAAHATAPREARTRVVSTVPPAAAATSAPAFAAEASGECEGAGPLCTARRGRVVQPGTAERGEGLPLPCAAAARGGHRPLYRCCTALQLRPLPTWRPSTTSRSNPGGTPTRSERGSRWGLRLNAHAAAALCLPAKPN